MSWEEDLKTLGQSLAKLQSGAEKFLNEVFDEKDTKCDSDTAEDCACQKKTSVAGKYATGGTSAPANPNTWGSSSWITLMPGEKFVPLNRAPRIGQDVHYLSYGTPGGEYPQTCRAAKIVAVEDADESTEKVITVMVCNPTGINFVVAPRDQDRTQGGTWHTGCDK